MDAAGLLKIEGHWKAWISLRGILCDSKAHKKMVQEKVCGEIKVEKLECVGHVQKRLGTLKNRLGKTPLQDGKSIGRAGRLPHIRIDKLQVFYGKATRENTHNIESMKMAVIAIWDHTKSTDEDPDHHLCPSGANSWCGFQ